MNSASALAIVPEPRPNASSARRGPGSRRLSSGAEITDDGVHFRVWAPERKRVAVAVEKVINPIVLAPDGDGYWSGVGRGLGAGARYRFRLDDDDLLLPDPFSRFQPEGPHGPSEVVDPTEFAWTDGDWPGVQLPGQIIYELHIGTFSPEGTWAGAAGKLPHLRDLGVTILEVMPVAEAAGEFGWGYDGVDLFAPNHHYGKPDDFRAFVDQAHRLRLAVILDVVYNHFGPDGNYLGRFSRHYFSDVETEWGRGINYDQEQSHGARTLAIENAAYWVSEYHLDGLRLDATQAIRDTSKDHLIAALTRAARDAAREVGPGRSVVIVGENEPQHAKLVRPPEQGGLGIDALYNEDLHHSAVVAATGRTEGYYSEYQGNPQELLSAVKHGFLFQGQRYHWQKQRRGQWARGIAPMHIAGFLENHDQVANSALGLRLWRQTSPGRHRALTTLLFCGPWTPFLFQGAEWCSNAPFFYFADQSPELAAQVRKGRGLFLAQFASCCTPEAQAALSDPGDRATFEASRLCWDELGRPEHAAALALHRDLISLRKDDPVLAAQGRTGPDGRSVSIDGAVLGPECFLVRYFSQSGDNDGDNDGDDDGKNVGEGAGEDRLLIVNLGRELKLRPAPEPLLAPTPGSCWQLLFSSEDRRYGGPGACPPESEEEGWTIPAQAACLLAAVTDFEHGQH
jgi:maltooligosyltrehalose trehalohydrolase